MPWYDMGCVWGVYRVCGSVFVYTMKNTNHLELVRALYNKRMNLLFDIRESMWALMEYDAGEWL